MPSASFSLHERCMRETDRIASWIVETALWSGDSCTWTTIAADYSIPGVTGYKSVLAGGELYQGTAGISLFLSELFAFTGRQDVLRTSAGALAYARQWVGRNGRAAFGFHSGRVGVAHALTRFGIIAQEQSALDYARDTLMPLFGNEHHDRGLDVIAGAAGAIPVLLQLAVDLDLPGAEQSAVALGDHLIASARRDSEGWSWAGPVSGVARNLCGFAHGAAGFAAALLELWGLTGEPRFRYAAERAFDYEAFHFDARVSNWPDFRDTFWYDVATTPSLASKVRAQLLTGRLAPRYHRHYMSAWCHGAPGIALSRLRAFELLGHPRFLAEARAAIASTLTSVGTARTNYSICHGASGDSEALIWGARLLGVRAWNDAVEEWLDTALTCIGEQGQRWPTGVTGGLPDPSLMMGEAGIGHFFLRFVSSSVPSVTFPCAPFIIDDVRPTNNIDARYELQREELESWFGRSLRAMHLIGTPVISERLHANDGDLASTAAVIEQLARTLGTCQTASGSDEQTRVLADAVRLDNALFLAMRVLPDFVDESIDELQRPVPSDIDWNVARLRLARCTTLVRCERDWDSWLASAGDARQLSAPAIADRPVFYVLYRRASVIRQERVLSFAAAVLLIIEAAPTPGVTCGDVSRELCAEVDDIDALRVLTGRVRDQIRQAYVAGILSLAEPQEVLSSSERQELPNGRYV